MKRLIVIICLSLCLTACRKVELYHDLSEEDANDMLVVLQQENIATSKVKEVKQNEVFWTIQVDPKRLGDARKLLVEHNLPRKKELGLSGVYKEKGLIPTPDEQKARFLLALKGEIINSLLRLPEVVDADVVLNVPTPDEFASQGAKEKRPTASVVIKAKPNENGSEALSESKVQQFVANTVENLNPRDVSVIISYLAPPKKGLLPGQSLILPSAGTQAQQQPAAEEKQVTKIAGLELVGESQNRLKIYLAIFFIILAVLAAALIITVIKSNRARQNRNALIEGKVVDEQPKLPGGR